MVHASVDVGIQNVSIRGWEKFRLWTTSLLPFLLHGTPPALIFVLRPYLNGSQTSQDNSRPINPGESMALAPLRKEKSLHSQTSQEEEETKRQILDDR